MGPLATAIPSRDFTSPGAPAQACSSRSCGARGEAEKKGLIAFKFRHRVDELLLTNGAIDGVRGAILEPSDVARGVKSSRTIVGEFALRAGAVIVASGGIGGNFDLVRQNWPTRLGKPPKFMVQGVPDHVDGRMLAITEAAGARLINRDRMWHYTEGIRNWNPIWSNHGIRILPGPSSLWLDATGKRLPPPLYPGFDTLGTLEFIAQVRPRAYMVRAQPGDHQAGVCPFRLRAEPGLDRQRLATDARACLQQDRHRTGRGVQAARCRLRDQGQPRRSGRRNERADGHSALGIRRRSSARSSPATGSLHNPFGKDSQLAHDSPGTQVRRRQADPRGQSHTRLLDPKAGPLIAVKLNILTRKTLGGLGDRPDLPACSEQTARFCPVCTPWARRPASAAAACTATGHSRARSWAAASSPGATRDGRPQRLFETLDRSQ